MAAIDINEYRDFISRKFERQMAGEGVSAEMSDRLKDHQKSVVEFALRHRRTAAFLDTGLGKTLIELEFARIASGETGRPSLILAPLAVAAQIVREGEKFGIEATKVRDQSEVFGGVVVSNYERLHKLDPSAFGAVILDESSILKSFGGKTSLALMEAFRGTPFKLAATATPAPNDHMEIGQHCQFLEIMPSNEMLSRWFIADQKQMGAYRLKGHAVEPFWQWVASWARCATLPSDLGADDDGYILPPIEQHIHTVAADRTSDTNGMLFRIPEMSATSFHAEKRHTLRQRCELAAHLADHDRQVIVWCETNAESDLLEKLIPDAVQVNGSQDADTKEGLLLGFINGTFRVLVTKPTLAGFGLNLQNCAHAIFASISFSYEQHYQAKRRIHRFGQDKIVRTDIIVSDTEASVLESVQRKSADHDAMKREMAKAMLRFQKSSDLHVIYGEHEKVRFPAWIKEEVYG